MKLVYSLSISFSLLFSQIALAQKGTAAETGKPFVLGTTRELYSKELGERRILNIYLPPGYNPKDSINYPVIYLLDGGADEDFIHVAGLVQFNTFEWVNRMPKSILVGIASVDRRRDFTYPTTLPEDQQLYPTAGHSDRFVNFLEKELPPFIAKNYKTNGSRTLIGESLGGLFATEVLFKHPTLFNQYIITSPSLWWDNGSLLKYDERLLRDSSLAKTKIYIGVGKEGVWPAKIPHVMEVDANLLADKLKSLKNKSLEIYFDYLPRENHATISHQALLNAFRILNAD